MERQIDIDQVAESIRGYAAAWEQAGLTVGVLTWRDVGVPWPYPLRTDRGEVADADSVGVEIRREEQEGHLVIFRGGWADLDYWSGHSADEPVLEAPGSVEAMTSADIGPLLQRFGRLFR